MMIRVRVNGVWRAAEAPPMKRLLDFLREELELTGTKEGCGEGECGACTVLIDGEPVNSCLVAACQAQGTRVMTVEGLARRGRLSRLQEAFLHGGAQCGICTPGMLMSAAALLERGGVPKEAAVREALAGNLCRCTGYVKIVEAVRLAARQERAVAGGAKRSRPAGRRDAKKSARQGAGKKATKRATKKMAGRKVARKSAKRGAGKKTAKAATKKSTGRKK